MSSVSEERRAASLSPSLPLYPVAESNIRSALPLHCSNNSPLVCVCACVRIEERSGRSGHSSHPPSLCAPVPLCMYGPPSLAIHPPTATDRGSPSFQLARYRQLAPHAPFACCPPRIVVALAAAAPSLPPSLSFSLSFYRPPFAQSVSQLPSSVQQVESGERRKERERRK